MNTRQFGARPAFRYDERMDDPKKLHPLPAQPDPRRWGYFVLGMLAAVAMMLLGAVSMRAYDAWLGAGASAALLHPDTTQCIDQKLLEEAWTIIREDFYGDFPSQKACTYGAIRGSLEALNDPYTYFIEPVSANREREHLQGKFGGIGAYLTLNEQGQIALSPMAGRPADKAGVRTGDILLNIDGRALNTPADLDAVTNKLRGPVGSKVAITVRRDDKTLAFTIIRAEIELPSVTWHVPEDAPDVGYIHIDHFSGLTDDELAMALNDLTQQQALQGLIIDLRGNPGGLVDAAVAAADLFLDGGPVLREKHVDGSEKVYKASHGTTVPAQTKVMVLVDGNSASAAEILAGALQDRQRATLIGEKTYGKGSIQRIHQLSDGSAVHVTFAKWFTPNNRAIDGAGLEPDVAVARGENEDTYVKQALALLRGN
jgi:carboxyl-terminal processing protease